MNRAVFLDRDGVINRLIFNPKTQEYESPHYVKDLELYPWVFASLAKLQKEYLLFVISNQPSFAKGKTTLENIKEIHKKFHKLLTSASIKFTEYYYCFHHPEGVVPEFTCKCQCRKPGQYFPLKAKKDYQLDMPNSWLIGDRDSDIFCGQRAGLRTILVNEPHSIAQRGKSKPDYLAKDLNKAEEIISNNQM